MNDICSICADEIGDDSIVLPCSHTFHPECVVQWFRYHNSSCPNCRSISLQDRWGAITASQRIAKMMKKNVIHTLPLHTQRKLVALKEYRNKSRSLRKEYSIFKKRHDSILKSYSSLKNRLFSFEHKQSSLERELTCVYIQGEPLLQTQADVRIPNVYSDASSNASRV